MQTFINCFIISMCMKKQEMIKVLDDPKQIELFESPTYTRIVTILRKGELNIKEIHRLFNKDYEDKKTLTSIYRYMEKLVENDLIFVSKEEVKRGHLIERYYSRTAKIFLFQDERTEENVVSTASELIQQIYGFDEEKREDIKKLIRKLTADLHKSGMAFFEKYGEEVVELEKKYGFKPISYAAEIIYELLYFRENMELIEKIFGNFKEQP